MTEQGDGVVAELRAQFRSELPARVEALDAEALGDLTAALRDARRRQRESLAKAADESLKQVPRLVRPLVRKVIGL
ncbi:hypothetical protein SAMN05192558_12036 [Actinokineospora alba]|uniref:Uncharacterized protein n=1 Tax=Actinokineospora alba TaxID=504798 RepID=A0A1H0WDP0_9PSEU|nr:hypothetical protein [Actinokineospora alba]TDP68891.1 hypothetical protein C8E96_4458 [Actinokineospora alba]SDI74352.1 hypothetical protein SAMN05421871_107161 [Actinokineospora alba]SDP88899.1 hypothetical protein SAMN05192558_12036 [Actinokineospora alba]